MPDQRQIRGAGLQLAELVLPGSQAGGQDGGHHSRALLLAGVGRAVKHAGQITLYLTSMHAAKDKLMKLIAHVRAVLIHVRAVAEQLPQTDRWKTFLDYVVAKITRPLPPWYRPGRLAMT